MVVADHLAPFGLAQAENALRTVRLGWREHDHVDLKLGAACWIVDRR